MAATDLVARQPIKGIWAIGAIIVNAIKLPFWVLYYASSATRQHPRWSLRQAVGAQALRACQFRSVIPIYSALAQGPIASIASIVEEPSDPSELPFGTFELLVPITPSSTPGVYGGICDDKQIKPVTICGYWYPSPYNPSEDKGKKVVLQFHGGAFVIGDSRPSQSGYAAGLLTRHVGKTLMVSYRLSSNPGGRFPAALQDALSALYYLIDLGVEYSDIVVSGDSAGGNIVVALLRHLSVANAPGPSAALLWSPWVDVAKSFTPEILYQSPHRWTDYIPPAFAIWGANTYCPKDAPVNMHDRWISPGPHPFYTKTPMWIQGNGQEILFEQIKEFANGMNLVEGNKIGFHNEETASHDILLVGNVTGFEKEAENAAKAAAEWLKLQQFISTK